MSQPGMADPHQLFDDTSSAQSRGYGAPRAPSSLGYPAASTSPQAAFLADPVSNMAMAYGSSLAAQGKELVDKNVSGLGLEETGVKQEATEPQARCRREKREEGLGAQWAGPSACGFWIEETWVRPPRSTASSPSASSSITSLWTRCTWAKSWASWSSLTYTRSAPPTPGMGGI